MILMTILIQSLGNLNFESGQDLLHTERVFPTKKGVDLVADVLLEAVERINLQDFFSKAFFTTCRDTSAVAAVKASLQLCKHVFGPLSQRTLIESKLQQRMRTIRIVELVTSIPKVKRRVLCCTLQFPNLRLFSENVLLQFVEKY